MTGWLSGYGGGAYTSGDWCNIAKDYQHPGVNGSTNDSVRRWTSPAAGAVIIHGSSRMSAANGGDGAKIKIVMNGSATLFDQNVAANNTTGITWYVHAPVSVGTTIDTIVNRLGNYFGDEQILNQTIQYVQFTPLNCNACGTAWEAVPWTYVIGGTAPNDDTVRVTDHANFHSNWNDQCTDMSFCHYISNIQNTRRFLANAYVHSVSIDIKKFRTQVNHDFMEWDIPSGTDAKHGIYSSPFSWTATVASNQSFQSTPGQVEFRSDNDSVVEEGVVSEGVHVCCGTANNSVPTLEPFYRTTGVLLGTNDTVYFKIPASIDSGIHSSIALQGQPDREFELYAKCGSAPTPTSWDFRSATKGSQEFLHYEDTAACPGGGIMYFAVNSTGGQGWFGVMPARHYASRHRTLRVGTGYNANSPPGDNWNYTQMKEIATTAVKRWYGATEGAGDWIDSVELYNSTDCVSSQTSCGGNFCDACFTNIDSDLSWCLWNVAMYKYQIQLAEEHGAETMTHEMGHCLWRWSTIVIADEYYSDGSRSCGHSTMATSGPVSNFCYADSASGRQNHGRNSPTTPPPTPLPYSQWEVAYTQGFTPWKPVESPDPYDYQDFDFKGLYGVVNAH